MLNHFFTLINKEPQPLVILDLDSTLYNVTQRSQRILDFFCLEYKNKYPSEIEIINKHSITSTDWGLSSLLKRTQKDFSQVFLSDLFAFWKKHFFSNDFLKEDIPYPGAVDFVSKVRKTQATIWYLTGRPEALMHPGTIESLYQNNFPLPDNKNVVLYMKNKNTSDEDYKLQIIKNNSAPFSSIFFFENEPVVINHIEKSLPQIQFYFMNSVHSQTLKSPQHLPTLNREYKFGEDS